MQSHLDTQTLRQVAAEAESKRATANPTAATTRGSVASTTGSETNLRAKVPTMGEDHGSAGDC